MSALIIFYIAALAGLGLLVAGVYILLGLGFSLLAGGIACLAFAVFIQRGLVNAITPADVG